MAIDSNTIAKLKQTSDADRATTVEYMGSVATPDAQYVERIDTLGEAFTAGIESGAYNIAAQNQNFLAAIDTLRGKDLSAANRLREADFLEDQAGVPLRGLESTFASAMEEGNIHDFFLNTVSATGQFIPSLAASLAEAVAVGGIVAATAGTATPGLVLAAGATSAARRKAVTSGTKAINQRVLSGVKREDVEDLFERAYKNQVAVKKGQAPDFKFTDKELLQLDALYGSLRSTLRGKKFAQGAVLGAFTQEQRMGTGIAFSDYVDQGMDKQQDAINSLLQGAVFGAVGVGSEALATVATIGRLKKAGNLKRKTADAFEFKPFAQTNAVGDIATIAGVTAGSEGLAEFLQEELSVQQKFRIDDTYTKAQAKIDRVNALFAGVMGGLGVGGGLGSGTAVMNKARAFSQRGAAEREMMRIFTQKETAAQMGVVMGERSGALETQFDAMKNENSNINAVFVPIEAKAEYAKVQQQVEAMFGDDELLTVSTPIGAFFTTDAGKAESLANLMDSPLKFDTGIIDEFLAVNLGYSRTRDTGDDIVVGVFDNEKKEFVKYQSARSDVKGDKEAAKNAMKTLRGALDPKRYTIEVQTLAQHRKFRQEGMQNEGEVLKALKEAYQTDETMTGEMNTDQDDTGVEGDRGVADPRTSATNLDIRRGLVTDKPKRPAPLDTNIAVDIQRPMAPPPLKQNATPQEQQQNRAARRRYQEQLKTYNASEKEKARFKRESDTYRLNMGQFKTSQGQKADFDNYIRTEYKLPLTYDDLVFFVQNTPANPRNFTKVLESLGEKNSDKRVRYATIVNDLRNADKMAVLGKAERAFIQNMNKDNLVSLKESLEGLLDEIAELGVEAQQNTSIDSAIARFESEGREIMNAPLVGVTEILNRTNVTIPNKPNAKDYKNGAKDKQYKKDLATYREEQRQTKMPLGVADPTVMKRFGSGTVENPFVDPKTGKGFQISKDDPAATDAEVNGLNEFIHTTLQQEFRQIKPYLSKSAVKTFRQKALAEREATSGFGFVRFVDVADMPAFINASKKGEVFQAPDFIQRVKKDPKKLDKRRYVIVRHQIEQEAFREITRDDVEAFRNIKEDLQTRTQQAYDRTRASSYNTPIYFYLQNMNPEAKQKTARPIDMAVLLEGVSTIAKRIGIRDIEEVGLDVAQRVSALLDTIDVLQQNNYNLIYEEDGTRLNMTGTTDVSLGLALDRIITQPEGPGAALLKIDIEKFNEQEAKDKITQLRQEFGLTKLASNFYTSDKFAKIDVPLVNLLDDRRTSINPIRGYIQKFTQNLEEPTMRYMTLDQLQQLQDTLMDVFSVKYSDLDKKNSSDQQQAQRQFLKDQDKAILDFVTEINKVINGINAYDIRNAPGTLDDQNTRQVLDYVDDDGEAVYKEVSQPKFVNRNLVGTKTGVSGPGGMINTEAEIGTYIEDIRTLDLERATPHLDETGMYGLDSPIDTQIIDNSSVKMDIQDRNLFESYTEQQAKEFRGRDRYKDMSFGKPKFKDNKKYNKPKPVSQFHFSMVKTIRDQKLSTLDNTPVATRAKLPFRQQILSNLLGAARQLGLTTNIHVIAAEEGYSDSNLPIEIKKLIPQKQFDKSRQALLEQADKTAKTISYGDFDVILMKTNPNITEASYYSAFLKELGNSFLFQELEKSLKIPETRKKLLQAYEQLLARGDAPSNYTNDDTGFENFVADQFSIAIRREMGMEVDGTVFDSMNKPAQAWFKRLAKSQKKMYNQSKTYRKRTESDESFQDYFDNLQDALRNPADQKIPYKTKAAIESQIESILGPETFTDKELRKVMDQASKLFRSKKLPGWLQKILLTADTRLRNYGPIGVEIADFFNQDPRTVSKSGRGGIFTLKNRRANAMFNEVAKILGVEDGWIYSTLSADQKKQLELAADDTKDTNTLPPKARAIREYLESIYIDLGLDRYGVGKRKNFFPRIIALAEIAGNQELQVRARKLLKEANPNVDDAQIADAVNDIVRKGMGELDFEVSDEIDLGMLKERKELWNNVTNRQLMDAGLALPAEVSLKQYLDKIALKYEFEQSGGAKELTRLMEKLTPEQQEDARKIIDSMFGKTPPIDKGWLKVANNVLLPVNIVTLLAFTVLASLQDTAGPVLRSRGTAKISDIASVIKTMVKNPTEAAELAREIGVIGVDAMSSFFIFAGEQNFMNQTAKNVSDVWFRVTLLEAYTKFTRVFATGMGTRFLQDSARKAKQGDPTAQLYLKELNVTADQVLAWEEGKADKATREKVNEALAQFVDESIVRPNPAQRPTYANNPRYALIWQLKSFFYAYGKTIVFPTLKESHRGFVQQGVGAGVMPLLLMAGILVPITMLGLEIRELTKYLLAELLPGIDGDDPGVNYFKSNSMSTGQYITEIIDRSGMLGPASLALPIFLESHRYGKPFWVPPLGPAAEKIYDGITWDWRAADYIPGYSQLDTRNLGR